MPHLRSLEADLHQLAEAFNRNSQVFSHGLTVAEMRLNVLERIEHDRLRGTLRTYQDDEGLLYVDFASYVAEFACCMMMSEFAAWLKKLDTSEKKTPSILKPEAEDVLVFGGAP